MKKITLVSTILFFSFLPNFLSAQWSVWTTPAPFTDNSQDNSQGIIHELSYNGIESFYLFWVKESASGSGIYLRDIYGNAEEIEVISSEIGHFRNPQIISANFMYGLEADFVLFYELNESGNYDLFYVFYDENGFSEPSLLSGSPANENHFRCSNEGRMVWEADGAIYYTEMDASITFETPIILDSEWCSSPGIMPGELGTNSQYVTWKKSIFDADEIYYSKLTISTGTWGEKIMVGLSYEIQTLEFANNTYIWSEPVIFWDQIDMNGNSTIHGYDITGSGNFESNFSRYGNFNVTGFLTFIPVKYFHNETYLAFENMVNGHSDIFVNNEPWFGPDSLTYSNLSDTTTNDINPDFRTGKYIGEGFNHLWLIWEKETGGKRQIYGSSTIIGGSGIDEKVSSKVSDVLISPNPISDNFSLSFEVGERSMITIKLLDNSGKEISTLVEREFSKGKQSIGWNTSQLKRGKLPSGMYYLQFEVEGKSWLEKLILQ
ncbi:MAG: T9SS type A sorting domain-containing protein [Bacteroidales bacterium]|nr:T9SS type A sorting domain-containing protein [Bacteroidales bacterium]